MKTHWILGAQLAAMALLILVGLLFPEPFLRLFEQPDFYLHAKFIHILSVSLFFANVVIGTIWETRSLLSGDPTIVRHTYRTVKWLDAVFTAPLILVAVLSGIMLGTILGGVWTLGWLSIAFCVFLVSGVLWLIADIPTQHKITRLFENTKIDEKELPARLTKLLWLRLGINLVSIVPLLFIFSLMVHKPDLPRVGTWFQSEPTIRASGTGNRQLR